MNIPGLICAAEHYDLPELLQACFHHAKQFVNAKVVRHLLRKSATVYKLEAQVALLHAKLLSQYLCHLSTELAEIWSPGTFFEDVWTYKISALYLLYF